MTRPFIPPHRLAGSTRDYGAVDWSAPDTYLVDLQDQRPNLYASFDEDQAMADEATAMAGEYVWLLVGAVAALTLIVIVAVLS